MKIPRHPLFCSAVSIQGGQLPSTTPQAAAASRLPPCVWPRDSIIEDFVLLARQYSESEDQILAGSFLP